MIMYSILLSYPWYLINLTEYAGHAVDLVKTLKLSEWGGVVVVSGDGLIFEVNQILL